MTITEQLAAAKHLAQTWAQIIPEFQPSDRQFLTWVRLYGVHAAEDGTLAVNAWINKAQDKRWTITAESVIRYASGCMRNFRDKAQQAG